VFVHAVGLAEQHEAAVLGLGQRHARFADAGEAPGPLSHRRSASAASTASRLPLATSAATASACAGAMVQAIAAGTSCARPSRRTAARFGRAGRAFRWRRRAALAPRIHASSRRARRTAAATARANRLGGPAVAERGHAMLAEHQARGRAGEGLQRGERVVIEALDRLHQGVPGGLAQQDRKSASQVEEGTLGLAHLFFSVGMFMFARVRCAWVRASRVQTVF
jgi:hypothetical protein